MTSSAINTPLPSTLPLLEVRDLRKIFVDKDFQTAVLKGVNFSLQTAEMVALLGLAILR